MPGLPKRLKNLPKHFDAYVRAQGRKNMLLIVLLFMLLILFACITYIFIIAPRGNILDGGFSFIPLTPDEQCEFAEISDIELSIDKQWYLVGKEFLDSNEINFAVNINKTDPECSLEDYKITYHIDGEARGEYKLKRNETAPRLEEDISDLDIGMRRFSVSLEKSSETITKNKRIYLSKPVYVAWTIDWEGYNVSETYLTQINRLTNRDQKVPLTHFFNPRYYTAGLDFAGDRFIKWIKNREKSHGDMIGLHIHMFYDLVRAAGVTPKTDPNWANRGTGSDVPLISYSKENQRKIIEYSIQVLKNKGLNNLRAFRAGGWYADAETMEVLDELGFAIESSGRNAYSLGNDLPGPWRLPINQQPYLMCKNDVNQACGRNDAFRLLQMPNNGGESFRLATFQLIDNFKENYSGGVTKEHIVVNFLSHPEAFYIDQPKMRDLFNHIDQFSYAADNGPVVYANLDAIRQAWILNN